MAPAEEILNAIEGVPEAAGPPAATVARRAKSYSDFYDVVRAHVRKEYKLEKEKEEEKEKRISKRQPRTDVEFGSWYNGVKGELLDASHEEYQYDFAHQSQ
jgi:hypothetical protein